MTPSLATTATTGSSAAPVAITCMAAGATTSSTPTTARLRRAPKNNDPNPGRNGESAGEMGLVLQHDAAWHDQTGAPTDPQAGNTPGTQRDVLRSADLTSGQATAFFVDSGTWSIAGGAYQGSSSGDAVTLYYLNQWLPSYYEVQSNFKLNSNTNKN